MKKLRQLQVPRLPRKWRILRNLALIPLLLALALYWGGWPGWCGYWAFRQAESSYLLTPSKLVRSVERREQRRGSWSAYLTEGTGWIAAGKSLTVQVEGPWSQSRAVINHVLAKEGTVVAALPAPDDEGGMTVAVWGAPPEALSGTLEVDLVGVEGGIWDSVPFETISGQGQREGEWFFFQLSCKTSHGDGEYCALTALWDWDARILHNSVGEHPYRLALTDRQGARVLDMSGTLPPNLWLARP